MFIVKKKNPTVTYDIDFKILELDYKSFHGPVCVYIYMPPRQLSDTVFRLSAAR